MKPDGRATATGYHPILYVSSNLSVHDFVKVPDMDVPKGEELIIQKFENRDSKEAVTFGTSVCIVSATGFFLSFNSSGDVKFDKHQGYDQFDSSIAKLIKWIIVDAKNSKSNNVVTPFDDIMLKSPFGQFLVVSSGAPDFNLGTGGGGIEISEQQIFRVVKASIPYLPDWLFKRPHLNHNGNSSTSQLLMKAGGTMSR